MSEISFLLYVSQATNTLNEEAQAVLREKALLNTNLHSITGILVFRKGYFMQYIEGRESEVLELFRQLRATGRHFNVRVLSRGTIKQRLFRDWSVRWVIGNEPGPSSESLIDVFETVLSSKVITSNEISAVLRRFSKNSEAFEFVFEESHAIFS